MVFNPELDRYVKEKLTQGHVDKELLPALSAMAEASVEIWRMLGGTADDSAAAAGVYNQFGEMTKQADLFARQSIAGRLRGSGVVLVTEEDVDVPYPADATHIVFVDPIDGSGHVDYGSQCGTFFSVVPRQGASANRPVVSGYALYGYQLIFVVALRDDMMLAAYDPDSSAFRLVRRDYKMPAKGAVYSLNDANCGDFPDGLNQYVQVLRSQGYTARYNGVLVADLHRIIMKGGIFMSPKLKNGKTKTKKYFEAVAIGHMLRAAGGSVVDDCTVPRNILDAGQEQELFSSTQLIFGSGKEINECKAVLYG